MAMKTSRIDRYVAAAVWVAFVLLSSEATPAMAAAPANLLARPGFEASEAALKAVWHPLEPGGYEVDRQEKHTGNQSIKLQVVQEGVAKGASYSLSSGGIKAPGTILVSAWSKAKGVTGSKDDAYAIYIDVNYADGTNLHQVTARFEPGTHDWQYASVVVPVRKAVARFSIHLLFRGDHTGTVWFDDVCAAVRQEGVPKYEGSSEAYEIPARVIEMRRRLPGLQEKTATLERLVNDAEAKGIDASALRVSLSVAKVFTPLLVEDASLEVADYPKDMIDFRILGREETLRRIESLALFEADQTEKVLDRAIAEAQAILKSPAGQKKAKQQPKPVTVQNGAFTYDGKPIFLSGILGLAVGGDPKMMDLAKDLGSNLLGPLQISHSCTRGWGQFDDSYFEKHVLPIYREAEPKGFWVSPAMWNYRAPAWLAKIAPDINVEDEDKGWFRDALDLDHPLTSRFETTWFKYAASQLKEASNNFCYSLMGEEWCNPSFRGKYTEPRYEEWLKRKHGDVATLNKAWGTRYKDFREAAGKGSLESKGGHYDWHRFNEDRLTAYNQAQIDGIRQSDPTGLWTCWPAAGCLVSAPVGGFDPKYGRNREDILLQSTVSGWDGGMFPYESGRSTRRLPESHWAKYNLGWRDDMIYYDFAKSLCPEKPVFDPELHSLTSVYHVSPLGVSADYFRTCLWMEHLHGLGAHLFWWWGRKADGSLYMSECLGGLLTQPQLLESWGRTVLELRRLTDYVAIFPQLERKVRILYSEASAIQDPEVYPLRVRDAYEAVYFLDYPAGFITEKMIREGKLADCSLLIVPGAKYVGDETVAKIQEYHETGGRLAIVGKESLTCDEYGNKRDVAGILGKPIQFGSTPEAYSPQLDYLTGSTPEEYAQQFDKAFAEVGIRRPVRCLNKEGKIAWGVEFRAASRDNKTIAYAINLNREAAEILIQTEPAARRAKDLITGLAVSMNRPLVLMPRRPMLLEISDHVAPSK
jgi:beta-galactosidase